jgi:hypothetical protein
MRKIIIGSLLFVSTCVFVFAQSDCENSGIFFVEKVKKESITFSSIFCDAGKLQTLNSYSGTLDEKSKLVFIDTETQTVSSPEKKQRNEFAKNLKERLIFLRNTYSSRGNILTEFIKDPKNFDTLAFQVLEQFVFTPEEKKVIQNARNLAYIDKNLYENTYGERLLM